MNFAVDDATGDAVIELTPNRSARVLQGEGLRLLTSSFHLDEGPHFAWVNPYRLLARGRLLGIGRETPVTSFGVEDGAAVARWDPFGDHPMHMAVTTRVVSADIIDTTFSVEATEAVEDYEMFVSSYFTANQASWFRVQTSPYWNDEAGWLQKVGATYEPTTWIRDGRGAQLLYDGRWTTGHPPLWFTIGSMYGAPLMVEVHHYADVAIATMAHPDDCIAIAGLWGYHNSQYFHLFGRSFEPGQRAEATVRLVVLPKADALDAAVAAYATFDAEAR